MVKVVVLRVKVVVLRATLSQVSQVTPQGIQPDPAYLRSPHLNDKLSRFCTYMHAVLEGELTIILILLTTKFC